MEFKLEDYMDEPEEIAKRITEDQKSGLLHTYTPEQAIDYYWNAYKDSMIEIFGSSVPAHIFQHLSFIETQKVAFLHGMAIGLLSSKIMSDNSETRKELRAKLRDFNKEINKNFKSS